MWPSPMGDANAPRRRGFTLLEVLVAMTILGILLMTVYGSVSRTIRSKDHAEATARMASTGREAVLRMADEIESSLSRQGAPGAVFQGVGAGTGQPLDQLRFVITTRPPFGPIGGNGGRVVVTYYLGEQEDLPGSYLLIRSEQPLPGPMAAEEGEEDQNPGQVRTLVVDNVAGLQFRYLDGISGQWVADWDSVEPSFEQRIPHAVSLTLLLYDEKGDWHEFSTIVDLPMASRTPIPG